MASLVIAEHNGNTLLPSTLSTITAAKAINSDIDILMLGYGIESIAVKASHIQGISTVFVADSPTIRTPSGRECGKTDQLFFE